VCNFVNQPKFTLLELAMRKANNGHRRVSREERLQIMLSPEELETVDTFRFAHRMPSRAAAVRELFRLGLAAVGSTVAAQGVKSSEYGVLEHVRSSGIQSKLGK
jgi:hypothetical protein